MSRNEFLKAGNSSERLEAALGDLLVRRLYVEWGLTAVEGLTIDGRVATVTDVIENAPEAFSDEIVEAIRLELGLTDEERKNS